MDALLARLGYQAVNYAMRCGIALTSNFAVQQCTRLLKTVDDKNVYTELKSLQDHLNSKIEIISPLLDLIKFKSGRGNAVLGNAAKLAKSLHRDIAALAKLLETTASVEEEARIVTGKPRASEYQQADLAVVIAEIKRLLDRIDRDAPMIQLAITGSGESLSTSVPPGISPSRFLQASAFLMLGDTQFACDPTRPVQIGPSLTLSLYMLFVGHSSTTVNQSNRRDPGAGIPNKTTSSQGQTPEPYGYGEGERKPIWKEVMHKCRVRLCRTPLHWGFDSKRGYFPKTDKPQGTIDMANMHNMYSWPDEFAYSLEIVEDLDDGRVHDEGDSTSDAYDGMPRAGLRECIPVYQISKLFYTDTGKILNIRDGNDFENHPVLLLKRDQNAILPRQEMEQMSEAAIDSPIRDDLSTTTESNEQDSIDRQLLGESQLPSPATKEITASKTRTSTLPPDLDQEWIALEVFVDDQPDSPSNSESCSDAGDQGSEDGENVEATPIVVKKTRVIQRSSVDAKLITQIRNLSIRSSFGPLGGIETRPSSSDAQSSPVRSPEQMVARSPFGNIASSLSLLEMLIRLTCLQETQQAGHLSIPDHILSFFLEEASTTGLRGEERWKARDEAKRRVGFDPYTDTQI